MKITRRRTTLGLLASSATIASPRVLRAQSNGTVVPADTPDIAWEMRAPTTEPSAYNLHTAKVPRIRARCQTEDSVKQVLEWAQTTNTPFSVQSGGHCYEGLSQNDELIIDLSALNRAQASPDGTLVAQPGVRLWQANDAAATISKALPAGYCQHVGLGGHVCGGGTGILSRMYGLACDNLVSARILTASGNFVDVSSETDTDLFWALRGGGSGSFGIVTEFRLKLHSVPEATLAEHYWLLPKNEAAAFLEGAYSLALTLGQNFSPYIYFTARSEKMIYVRLRMVSFKNAQETHAVNAQFDALAPPLTETQVTTGRFVEIANLMWPRSHDPKSRVKNKSVFLDGRTNKVLWPTLIEALSADWEIEKWVSMERLGGQVDAIDPTDTAFVHRQGPQFVVVVGADLDKDDTKPALASIERAFLALKQAAIPGTYVNYPDLDLPEWQDAYWGPNYQRLLVVKQRVDPANLFRHKQSVGSV